jgi:hypothetical protein
MSSALSKPQLENELLVPLRDPRSKKIRSVSTLHNFNVGVVEKTANFIVSGEATIHGISKFEGGAIGALFYPDGSPAIEGEGINVSITQDKKLRLTIPQSRSNLDVSSLEQTVAQHSSLISAMQHSGSIAHITNISNQIVSMSGSLCDVLERITSIEKSKLGAGTMIAMNVVPEGEINGQNLVFVLPSAPSPASSLMFFKNGQLLASGSESDYTLSSRSVTLSQPPQVDDVVAALYSFTVPVKSYSINEPVSVTTSNDVVTIPLLNSPNPPETLMLFMNGQLLTSNEDFLLNQNNITLNVNLKEIQESRFFATYTY